MSRCYNFCAGPAALPDAVLLKAKEELLDWHGAGLSIMEMSHRSKAFIGVAEQAERDLRELLNVPSHYKVLFLQGGATTQFAAIPLNLTGRKHQADYVCTGQWSKKAIAEAKRFCDVKVVASSESTRFTSIPPRSEWGCRDNSAYLHYTPNETIGGVEFHWIPETNVPLVADMSSTILSRPTDVSQFGVIYAGAQKNIGPAGLTLVIVREDLLGQEQEPLPSILSWKVAADNQSMYNTPPTFSIYLAGLVFQWIKEQGGLSAMADLNQRKANKLYTYIDQSDFYANPVEKQSRSWMNVPFTLKNPDLDKTFLEGAQKAGLLNLAGHRSVGGMRASIYNAVTEEAVDALIAFMQDFAERNS
jgi:phosphoserine aminotransferase